MIQFSLAALNRLISMTLFISKAMPTNHTDYNCHNIKAVKLT